MDAMTKRPTFKESWLTGEIPFHPALQMAMRNAILRAREVLAGCQEETVRGLWDTLDTVLKEVLRKSPILPPGVSDPQTLGELLRTPFERKTGDSIGAFSLHIAKPDPDLQRILEEVSGEKIVATLVLGEVDRGNVLTAIEWAALKLDPIRYNENILPEYDWPTPARHLYLMDKISLEALALEKQTKTIVPKEMGRKGGSSGKRGVGPAKHAIRRVSEKIGSTKSNKVINAFDNADLMADLKDALSDPIRLEVLGVDYEKKEIRYRRLSDGRDDKFTFKTLQNHLSKINKTR